jgi:hypothetical protein
LSWLGVALGFVGASLLVPLLQKEVEEGLPWVAELLVWRAARKMPAELQERFEEEWAAELRQKPGRLIRLGFAVRITWRARSTSRAYQGLPSFWEELLLRLQRGFAAALSGFRVRGDLSRWIGSGTHLARTDERRSLDEAWSEGDILLNTTHVARKLHASHSDVIAWAEAGMLLSVVTPKGHRRYPGWSVDELAFKLKLGVVRGDRDGGSLEGGTLG